MLILKKIKRDNEYIEAYYSPEDNNEEGYIKIRLSDNKVVEKRLTSKDKVIETYFIMARKRLRAMKNDEDIPEWTQVMWY